jgi:imidazolonepropionase
MGASRLAAEVGCVSADHLERIDEGGIAALRSAGVIAGLLPGCSFYLGVAQAPARRLLDSGVPVAFATTYNPGSSMVESLPLALSIACTQMRVTPSEALVGATSAAAAALRREKRLGRIETGMDADLAVLDVPTVDEWLSEVGRSSVRTVLKRGRVVHESPRS